MLFNESFIIFADFFNFPCYPIRILHILIFLSIFNVIRWEICIFLFFCKFAMLFNGKFAFFHFLMVFNGDLRIEKLWGGKHTDGRTDVKKFTLVSYRTSAPRYTTNSSRGWVEILIFTISNSMTLDQWTDGSTDRRTNGWIKPLI